MQVQCQSHRSDSALRREWRGTNPLVLRIAGVWIACLPGIAQASTLFYGGDPNYSVGLAQLPQGGGPGFVGIDVYDDFEVANAQWSISSISMNGLALQ